MRKINRKRLNKTNIFIFIIVLVTFGIVFIFYSKNPNIENLFENKVIVMKPVKEQIKLSSCESDDIFDSLSVENDDELLSIKLKTCKKIIDADQLFQLYLFLDKKTYQVDIKLGEDATAVELIEYKPKSIPYVNNVEGEITDNIINIDIKKSLTGDFSKLKIKLVAKDAKDKEKIYSEIDQTIL